MELTDDELTFGAKACDIHRQHAMRRATQTDDESSKQVLVREASACETLSSKLKAEQRARLSKTG